MTYNQKSITFKTPLNLGPDNLVTQFNNQFNAGLYNIQSVDFNRLESTAGAGDLQLKVVYGEITNIGNGVAYEARLYQTNNTQTAQEAYNADFASGLARVPLFFLDITDHERSRSGNDWLFIVMAITDRGAAAGGNGLVGLPDAVFAASPTANIAAGATGIATLYDAIGTIVAMGAVVTNLSTTDTWLQNERSMVVYDWATGTYSGIPTCCGGATITPNSTTTYAPLDVPCITKEVPSITPVLSAFNTCTTSFTTPPP